MARSLKTGKRVRLDHVGLFADGVAVKQVGKETFRLCRQLVDEMVLVDTDEMCAAIKDVFEDTRVVLEPAGALAIAGAKAWVERPAREARPWSRSRPGRTPTSTACASSPRTPSSASTARRSSRSRSPSGRAASASSARALGARNVTEFNYRIADSKEAHVFVGVEVHDREETARIVRNLRRHGLRTLDLSDDEMAKRHMRHMVGGRAPFARNELLYRFEFPERPGALMRFLEHARDWNISLFHYRNHGADYGRVLVGMQVPGGNARLPQFLRKLGYPYADETRNPAYRLFLL